MPKPAITWYGDIRNISCLKSIIRFWNSACYFWSHKSYLFIITLVFHVSACHKIWHQILLNGLNLENKAFLQSFFVFFSSRTEKTQFVLCRRFLSPSDVFSTHFTPLQSLRVATSSAKGCYVLRSATPKGPRPSLRTPQPFAPDSTTLAPFVPFRSLRKVVRDPKKSLRTRVFSVLSSEKKKIARTLTILKVLRMYIMDNYAHLDIISHPQSLKNKSRGIDFCEILIFSKRL